MKLSSAVYVVFVLMSSATFCDFIAPPGEEWVVGTKALHFHKAYTCELSYRTGMN